MAKMYALLQPDGSLLAVRQKGDGWAMVSDLRGVESQGRNLTVFLNGLDVLGVTASIPARNEREAQRAAPFAIEDEIAEAVETSHVVVSAVDKSNPKAHRQINVASAATLTSISEHLNNLGLEEASIVAAHSVLPDHNILYQSTGVILGRLGTRSFAVDASLGRDVIISFIENHSETEVYGDQLAQAVGRTSSGSGASNLEAFLIQLASWSEDGERGLDLRQGAFKPHRSVDFVGIGQWKLFGGLAAIGAIGWIAMVLLQTHAMETRSIALDELASEFARVGWPETNGDVQQVLALTQNSRGNATKAFPSVLDAAAVLYESLAQVEGSELRMLRYDRLRRQMTVTISFESFADVDRLTAVINATELTARSGDSRQSGSRVVGDLTLEASS